MSRKVRNIKKRIELECALDFGVMMHDVGVLKIEQGILYLEDPKGIMTELTMREADGIKNIWLSHFKECHSIQCLKRGSE